MMVHERAARVRRGVQHHAAMNGKPLAAFAAAALARCGLTTPPADAAAARVPRPLRGGRRTVTVWRRATHSADAAAAGDAASSTGATLRGAVLAMTAKADLETWGASMAGVGDTRMNGAATSENSGDGGEDDDDSDYVA